MEQSNKKESKILIGNKDNSNHFNNLEYLEVNKNCMQCNSPFKSQIIYLFGKQVSNASEHCDNCISVLKEIENNRKKNRFYDENITKAEIPNSLREKNFSNYEVFYDEQKQVKDQLIKYADNFKENLKLGQSIILSGSTGTGKSHLASALIKEIIYNQYTAKIIECEELADRINKSPNYKDQAYLQKIIHLDFLALDELHNNLSSLERKLIIRIIRERYSEEKPTMIITELSGKALRELLGDAVVNRLKDRTRGAQFLVLKGPSYR